MKKFSNITGQKVNEEPKLEPKQLNEEELFKGKLLSLMDQFLSIRTYGPVDRHQRAGLIKVAGKELLVEAILDLLSEKSIKEQTKILEGLKTEIRDWDVIDAKIDSLNKERTLISNRNKFHSLLEKYQDSNFLIEKVKISIDKINNEKTLVDYIQLTTESKLDSKTKSDLVKIYSDKLNNLKSMS